jgi:hypothetical protein
MGATARRIPLHYTSAAVRSSPRLQEETVSTSTSHNCINVSRYTYECLLPIPKSTVNNKTPQRWTELRRYVCPAVTPPFNTPWPSFRDIYTWSCAQELLPVCVMADASHYFVIFSLSLPLKHSLHTAQNGRPN